MARKPTEAAPEPVPEVDPQMLQAGLGPPLEDARIGHDGTIHRGVKDFKPWTPKDDLLVLGRIQRMLEPAPPAARARMRAYLLELLTVEIPF